MSWQLLVLMRPHVTASFKEPPVHSSNTSHTYRRMDTAHKQEKSTSTEAIMHNPSWQSHLLF